MERVDAILQQMLYGRPRPRVSDREREARAAVIERLFALYREKDADLANQYIRSTEEIPLFFLAYAVIAIERSRVYSSLPQTGEIWTVARRAAGMDREQYHAGHFLPPPRDWPPAGQRHAITAGEMERLPANAGRWLAAGTLTPLLEDPR